MRKNNMLRIASVLLVAVLLSTCAISGVFANYMTTIADDTDKAQVAKWGVKIVTGDAGDLGLFDDKYAANGAYNDKGGNAIENTVVASETWNLVAPGTTKTWNAFDVSGKPEVAVNVTYTAAVTLAKWSTNLEDATATEYCPIVFTVGTTEIKMAGEIDTVAELEAAIEAAIVASSGNYAANTDLSTIDFPTITWNWDFNTDVTKDTALGDNAAAGNPATIEITVGATVTQLD